MKMLQFRTAVSRAVFNIISWSMIFAIAFPLLWMITTAFKPEAETFAYPPAFLPVKPTLLNFEQLIYETPFLTYFKNSLIVSIGTTALVIVVATLGAYSIVRFRYRGRRIMGLMILFTYLLPAVVLLLPLYIIMSMIGLSNSLFGLMIAYTTFGLPFSLWLLRSFIASTPIDLEHAAMVDGASRMRAFFDVVLPQAFPGIISTALFTFILSWNEYLYAMVFIVSGEKKTLPPGVIGMLSSTYNIEWALLMTASVLMAVPVLISFAFLQKHLTKGFGAGAVKG